MNIKWVTHFTGKRISVDLMLRSLIIIRSVMNVNFLKLISVSCGKWEKKNHIWIHAVIWWTIQHKPRGPPEIFTCCFISLSTRNTNDCPVLWSIPVTYIWTEGTQVSLLFLKHYLHTLWTTLCLSMWSGRKYGSNNNLSGSMLIGDWRRPLLHMFQTGFMRPQKPDTKLSLLKIWIFRQNLLFNLPGPEMPS